MGVHFVKVQSLSCKNTYFHVIFVYCIWHWIYLLLQVHVLVCTDMLQVESKNLMIAITMYLLCFKTMYKERSLEFLIDESDTVHNYEQRGRDKTASSQYEKGMQALSSMNRVQQVEVLHGKVSEILSIFNSFFFGGDGLFDILCKHYIKDFFNILWFYSYNIDFLFFRV